MIRQAVGFLQMLPEKIRDLPCAGRIEVRSGIVAVGGVIDDLVHVHEVEVLDAVFFRRVYDGVGVELFLAVVRAGIGEVGEQHADAPALAILNEAAQIDKAKALLVGGRAGDFVDCRHSDGDVAFAAKLLIVMGLQILRREIVPARVVLDERKDELRAQIPVALPLVVCKQGIIREVEDCLELCTGHRKGVQRGMHFAAGSAELRLLPDLIDVQDNDLGLTNGKRIAHHPVGNGNREVVVGQIIGGDAVIRPQLHGIEGTVHVAVSEEQHVDLTGALEERGELFAASLVFKNAAKTGEQQEQHRKEGCGGQDMSGMHHRHLEGIDGCRIA